MVGHCVLLTILKICVKSDPLVLLLPKIMSIFGYLFCKYFCQAFAKLLQVWNTNFLLVSLSQDLIRGPLILANAKQPIEKEYHSAIVDSVCPWKGHAIWNNFWHWDSCTLVTKLSTTTLSEQIHTYTGVSFSGQGLGAITSTYVLPLQPNCCLVYKSFIGPFLGP